ncbi:SpaA isopeptide-forming pilin-related protein [Kutzneria sp. NPDC052558]|uniref:SpaA isopeptide-forming pilin-related protein n=1 Tax=Kutzneria sp. NPDC052558 TaxID=3364121 RepID=UPI0037CB7193
MGLSKLVAGVTGITMLAGAAMLAAPVVASAAPTTGYGHAVTPAQPYLHNPDTSDWLGSYVVGGKQVYCVRFALNAPDSDTPYKPGDVLKDKWGNALAPDVAAKISYLLLRYADTTDPDQAAALAHLLHSYTSGVPAKDPRLDPANDFNHIGYDTAGHLAKLQAQFPGAYAAVAKEEADATANQGPWDVSVVAPTAAQIIGTADKWTVKVTHAGTDKLVTGVPVKLTVSDGTVEKDTVTTPADGSPLVVDVTPTGPNPTIKVDLSAPADQPVVQAPVNTGGNLQWIVSTGGEKALSGTAKTTAVTAPGTVKVTKVDSKTGAGIANAQLRITAGDKTASAIKQDGSPLNGADGKPVVVTTGADGTATVDNLKTPQDICLIEVAAPAGYDQNFNASSPPNVCGTVQAGQTLALKVANTPNTPTVPVKIPAGGSPMVADAATVTTLDPAALGAVGGLVVIALGGVGLMLRRRRHATRG